jgi:ribonuclease P protein component
MERLRKRREFLKVQKGRRANTGLFSVQALARGEGGARIGFTVSKKVDVRAVKRNRIRRRLKEAARQVGATIAGEGVDFVVVARADALMAPFDRLRSELERTMAKAAGLARLDNARKNDG